MAIVGVKVLLILGLCGIKHVTSHPLPDVFPVIKLDANVIAQFFNDFTDRMDKIEKKHLDNKTLITTSPDDEKVYDMTKSDLLSLLAFKTYFYIGDLRELDCEPKVKETTRQIADVFNQTYIDTVMELYKEKHHHPKDFSAFMDAVNANNTHQSVRQKFDEIDMSLASNKSALKIAERMRAQTEVLETNFDKLVKQLGVMHEIIEANLNEQANAEAEMKNAVENAKVEVFNDLA